MKNSTNISFECFKAGKLVTTLTIDPNKDHGQFHFKLERPPQAKLFAHTAVIGNVSDSAPPGALDEVTTKRQLDSLLTRIFSGEFGEQQRGNKPNIVMVTIHQLEG